MTSVDRRAVQKLETDVLVVGGGAAGVAADRDGARLGATARPQLTSSST